MCWGGTACAHHPAQHAFLWRTVCRHALYAYHAVSGGSRSPLWQVGPQTVGGVSSRCMLRGNRPIVCLFFILAQSQYGALIAGITFFGFGYRGLYERGFQHSQPTFCAHRRGWEVYGHLVGNARIGTEVIAITDEWGGCLQLFHGLPNHLAYTVMLV